jgi:hypothetical protein
LPLVVAISKFIGSTLESLYLSKFIGSTLESLYLFVGKF